MDRGLRERVRWGNVALAVGVVTVVAVVVLWPVLAPESPRVPGGMASQVATVGPRAVMPRAVAPPVVRRSRRPVVRGERRAGEGGGDSRPRRRRPRAVVTPAVPRVAPAVPRVAPAVPRVAPAVPRATPTAVAWPPVAPPAVVPPSGRVAPAPADPDPALREFGPESG